MKGVFYPYLFGNLLNFYKKTETVDNAQFYVIFGFWYKHILISLFFQFFSDIYTLVHR